MSAAGELRVGVLGPLEVTLDDAGILPSAAKPRTLLALLATSTGTVLSREAILSELWPGERPRTAAGTLHTYVKVLRRRVAAAVDATDPAVAAARSREILRFEQDGYVLAPVDTRSDASEFSRLVTDAVRLLRERTPAAARTRLAGAEALWRGRAAFADVRLGPKLAAEAVRLEELARAARERRIRIDLHLGRHDELLGELAGLTAEHPTDERLRGLYATALYRCGHRVRALVECDLLRDRLHRDFGVRPSGATLALRQAILVGGSLPDDHLVGEADDTGTGVRT